MKKQKTFAPGAITLCSFLIVGKAIGAIYRLPLTWILGSVGIGIYQMIFPLYSLLLTVSSSAIPQALSKLISQKRAQKDYSGIAQVFICSIIWLLAISAICTALVCFGSGAISELQGNAKAYVCYFGIAPALVFVAVIAVFRGFFQGFENMVPSGISSLLEQVVKMVAGLIFAYLFLPMGVEWGVFGALLGVSVSEFVSAVYLLLAFLFFKNRPKILRQGLNFKQSSKSIFSICLPVTIGGLILPLVQFIDSGLVVKLLVDIGFSKTKAISLFGLSSGAVGSLINLPVVLSLAIATAVLPSISKNSEECANEKVKATINKSIILTLFLVLPCALGLIMLSRQIIEFLYGGVFSEIEITITANLLRIGAISCIFLALTQVSSGILQGKGKFKIPMLGLLLGGVFKVLANVVLIKISTLNILGDQIANTICFFTATLVNFSMIFSQISLKTLLKIVKIAISGAVMCAFLYGFVLQTNSASFIAIFCAIILGAVVYFGSYLIISNIGKKREVVKICKK